MSNERQIKQWHKYRRQSIVALPVAVGLLFLVSGALFLTTRFLYVPQWLQLVPVGALVFAAIGDAINIVYLGWRLRSEENDGRGRGR